MNDKDNEYDNDSDSDNANDSDNDSDNDNANYSNQVNGKTTSFILIYLDENNKYHSSFYVYVYDVSFRVLTANNFKY